MLEKICFNLISFALFIIIFFKIIKKNDTNYIGILVLQAIGILISFLEIKTGINADSFFIVLRYLLSIMLPIAIIILEFKGLNFSESISTFAASLFIMFRQ